MLQRAFTLRSLSRCNTSILATHIPGLPLVVSVATFGLSCNTGMLTMHIPGLPLIVSVATFGLTPTITTSVCIASPALTLARAPFRLQHGHAYDAYSRPSPYCFCCNVWTELQHMHTLASPSCSFYCNAWARL
ncbi:hypothetical protein JVU11DRAFT_2203 [Chiua virens]|nr:hypothetical protein JVU11DRAFT_2203 [Chiua virens]